MTPTVAWIFSLLCLLAPPERAAALPSFPGWSETAETRTVRYVSIAEDVASASTDPRELALLVAVAFHESGFAPDVDAGNCYRGVDGRGGRCDAGRAVSLWQIHASGEDAADLAAHRRKATARALTLLRRSAAACVPRFGRDAALRVYAGGSCERGAVESRDMVAAALRLLRSRPPTAL